MLITIKLKTWANNLYYGRYVVLRAALSSFHTSKIVRQVKEFTQSPF